jgi:hypothetical protein
MPKQFTFPYLYDSVVTFKVSDLIRFGFLKKGEHFKATSNWSRNGERTASVSYIINTSISQPYIEFNYNSNGNPINYRVSLITMPSNLGKGEVWYFICSRTGKKCRNLYLYNGYFVHREALKGLYSTQIQSKYYRLLENTEWCKEVNIERLMFKAHKKHFKRYYAGKPTKRYRRILEKIEAIKNSYTVPFY